MSNYALDRNLLKISKKSALVQKQDTAWAQGWA